MPFYLVYEPCPECDTQECFQCVKHDRQLALRAVQADALPKNSLNGPCATPADLLERLVKFFDFDADTGKMYFKVTPIEGNPHE
jgi:hypothetical protein